MSVLRGTRRMVFLDGNLVIFGGEMLLLGVFFIVKFSVCLG